MVFGHIDKRFIQKRTGVYILQKLCREIKEEEGKAVEVGISLLVILVGHIDKKINVFTWMTFSVNSELLDLGVTLVESFLEPLDMLMM